MPTLTLSMESSINETRKQASLLFSKTMLVQQQRALIYLVKKKLVNELHL